MSFAFLPNLYIKQDEGSKFVRNFERIFTCTSVSIDGIKVQPKNPNNKCKVLKDEERVELQSWHPAKKFAPNAIGAANLKSIHTDIENAFRMEMQDLVFQDGPARYLISLFKVAGRASREAGLNSVTINDDFSECADLRFFITNQVKLWLPEKIKDGIVNKLGRVSSTIPLDKCLACVLAFVRSQVRFNLYSLVWQKFIQLMKTVERGQLEGQEPALYLDEIQTPLAEIAEIELPIRTKDKWDRNCPADQEDKIQKLDLRENAPFISMIMGIASEGLLSGNRQQNIDNRVEGYTRDYETWMDIWGTDLGKTLPDEVYKPPPPQPGDMVNGVRVPHPYEKGTYVMKAAGPLMGLQDPKSWGRAGGQNISQAEGKDKKQKGQKQKDRENRRFTQYAQREKEKEWAGGNVQERKEQQGYPRGKAWLVAAETAINTALNSQIAKDDPAIAAVIERRWKENPDAFVGAHVEIKPTGGNKSGGWKDGWESE